MMPADDTINRIAAVLEVAPGYLKGGYTMPAHLTEDDILFFADFRNVQYIKMVRESAEKGITAEDLRKLIGVITQCK